MSTKVFVQRDGIVNHQHDGVKGWHNPATKHGTDLHSANAASAPTNAADLTAETAAQYAEALAGKSFYGQYAVAVKTRREAAGEAWNYGKREAAKAEPPTVDEELDALEEAFKVPTDDASERLPDIDETVVAGKIVKA